jgi:hypothetical protein
MEAGMADTDALHNEDRLPFESPVCVRIGDSTNREVNSVHGASEVMIDWPHARRGPQYHVTVDVLEAARAGRATAEEARAAFLAFARHAGVHVDS